MTEADAIARTHEPATTRTLVRDLHALGVTEGMTLMVHSSLSALGFVVGGASTVVLALLEAVGPDGTLMMPTHSTDLSDPASWSNPPVPESWWPILREEMPAYDPTMTPTRGMGAIVESFRHVPDVLRSAHPSVSAAARGPLADRLVAAHPLDHGLGERSPQARLYECDGHILLLGVDHTNNTSLHLAEYRSPPPGGHVVVTQASPVTMNGQRVWATFDAIEDDDEDFERLGDAFAETGLERRAPIGIGTGRLMRARDIVDFAATWMATNRHGI